MQTDNEKVRQTWRERTCLRVVVDPHRLMESNFRAVYRITLMGGHQSLTDNERLRKSRRANGRASARLRMPNPALVVTAEC
jgi:hypothetical protein